MRQAEEVTGDVCAVVLRPGLLRVGTRAQGAASAGPGATHLPLVTGHR